MMGKIEKQSGKPNRGKTEGRPRTCFYLSETPAFHFWLFAPRP